ncbi:hypothetical protein JCM33374_g6057 [Metschnikowia sp. JCM 33374]|nr:hypothetical protein JCM33374_g6057 [Metschnikowia sp. JCM 33374]
MPTAKLSLQTPECLLSDIQIWSNAELSHPGSEDRLNLISVVNHSKIPLFLVSCGPFDVYSEHHDTEGYFFDTLVCSEENMGLLAKTSAENSECYVVFYVDRASAPRVRCYYIDFSVLQQVDEMRSFGVENREEDVFFTAKTRANTEIGYQRV